MAMNMKKIEFKDLNIGDIFILPWHRDIYKKKSLSSAYVLKPDTLEHVDDKYFLYVGKSYQVWALDTERKS